MKSTLVCYDICQLNHGRLLLKFNDDFQAMAITDFTLLKDKGGGWISLDLRGLRTGAYLLMVVLHIVISTIIMKYLS